jgi:molybdenum-dependent DNA-binding transcriptional regulator ModE
LPTTSAPGHACNAFPADAARHRALQTVGEATKSIKDGFSTYRLMLRRRRRRLAREASLHVELKGEEIAEANETLEGHIVKAEGGAGATGAAAGTGAGGGAVEIDEDTAEYLEAVAEMDEEEVVEECESEGVEWEHLDGLEDIRAALVAHLTGGPSTGGGAGAAEIDEDTAEYLEAIAEMDEEEVVEECENEGVEWEHLDGLEEIRAALVAHFTGGASAGGGAAAGEIPDGSNDDDSFYADLISDMDLETALAAAEDEALDFPEDISLEDAKAALLEHYCPGQAAGSSGAGEMEWLQKLDVKPEQIYPLTFKGNDEAKETVTSMGLFTSTRVKSITKMLCTAVAVAGKQKFSFESDTDSDSDDDEDDEEDASPAKPSKAAAQPDKNGGAVALVSQILRILPEIPLVDNEGTPAVTVEETRQLMALLKPYKTGGPLPPPKLVVNACTGLRVIADIGDDHRTAIGDSGGILLFADWLGQSTVDAITIAVCKVLAAVCSRLSNARLFFESGAMPNLLAVLNNPQRSVCYSAVVEVLAKIVAHQPDDGEIATIVVTGAGQYDGLDALFNSLRSGCSADYIVTVCRVLFFLTEDELTRQKALAPSSKCMQILGDLFHQFVREKEVAAIEHITSVWLQFAQGHEAPVVAEYLAKKCMKDIRTAFEQLPKEVTVQQCLIALIAIMGVSTDIKMAVAREEMLDGIVVAMKRFRGSSDPRYAEIQEQGCRALNAISKGEEKIKEYLADRQDELQVMEAIAEAMDNFKKDEGLVLAACSAVWSVAFKNVRMKNRAGEVGVFPTIIELIRMHKRNTQLLPHAFVAIGNLSANHAPNQALCGQEGVVEMCLEIMPIHRKEPTIMYTLLSCLNAVIAEQADNVAKFREGNGVEMVEKVRKIHSDDKVQQLSANVLQCVRQDEEQAKLRQKGRRRGSILGGMKGSGLEDKELGREPMAALSLHAKATLLKQGKCQLRYKKGAKTEAKMVFLLQHQLKFFRAGATDFKRAEQVIPLALLVKVTGENIGPNLSAPCLTVETRLADVKKFWMYPTNQTEAAQWLRQLRSLVPEMDGKATLTDGRDKAERHLVWQGGALFTFATKKYEMKRCYAAKRINSVEYQEKFSSFVVHEEKCREFRYQFSGSGGAGMAQKWQTFIDSEVSGVKQKKKAEDEATARKAEKAAQAEKERIRKAGASDLAVYSHTQHHLTQIRAWPLRQQLCAWLHARLSRLLLFGESSSLFL